MHQYLPIDPYQRCIFAPALQISLPPRSIITTTTSPGTASLRLPPQIPVIGHFTSQQSNCSEIFGECLLRTNSNNIPKRHQRNRNLTAMRLEKLPPIEEDGALSLSPVSPSSTIPPTILILHINQQPISITIMENGTDETP